MANQRLLPIKNGYNFRDLGGYPTADGHQIKWHRLIRTGSLARLDQTDLTVLDNIPISLDIDLRAPDEVKKDPDRVPSQAKYYHLPVFEADEYLRAVRSNYTGDEADIFDAIDSRLGGK